MNEENKNQELEFGETIEINSQEINDELNKNDITKTPEEKSSRAGSLEINIQEENKLNEAKNEYVEKNKKKKKSNGKINKRMLLLILTIILVIIIFILLLVMKINKLKAEYAIPKEVESVFDESDSRKEDPDLKYVMDVYDTYRTNDLTYVNEKYYNLVKNDGRNDIPYDQLYHECTIVHISGLKDKNVEDAVNKTLADALLNIPGSLGAKVYGYENVKANFGNVLSVEVSYNIGGKNFVYLGYNFNL